MKEALSGFGKGVSQMTYTEIIGLGTAVILLFSAGSVYGTETGRTVADEQVMTAKSYVEVKCDPCDYNIDYGDTVRPAEKEGVDEGAVKLECDPCDYNVDYGSEASDD